MHAEGFGSDCACAPQNVAVSMVANVTEMARTWICALISLSLSSGPRSESRRRRLVLQPCHDLLGLLHAGLIVPRSGEVGDLPPLGCYGGRIGVVAEFVSLGFPRGCPGDIPCHRWDEEHSGWSLYHRVAITGTP